MDKEIESVIAAVNAEPDGVAAIRRACWEIVKRNKALEAQSRAAASVQPQIANLQERVGALEARIDGLHVEAINTRGYCDALQLRCKALEAQHSGDAPSEVRYIPVGKLGDHRDAERPVKPAPMMVCELAETCVQTRCQSRVPHVLRDSCTRSCCAEDADEGRCVPVPQPVPAVFTAALAPGGLRSVLSDVPAVPDVPTPVGTAQFRERLAGHMQELSEAYRWAADRRWTASVLSIKHLKHLANVACTLRDAYDLARIGKHVEAMEKLEEIEW